MKINKFISFEGIDGSGKTTQINILKNKLENNNFKVMVFREPGGTDTTEKIRDIILDTKNSISKESELFLFLAARAELVKKVIQPALNNDCFVICDRYIDSTVAYQGYGRNLDLEIIKKMNSFATSNLFPSFTFYLDINPNIMNVRMSNNENDRIEQEHSSFFKDVRNGYLILEKNEERFIKIDAGRSIDSISKDIWNQLELKFLGK